MVTVPLATVGSSISSGFTPVLHVPESCSLAASSPLDPDGSDLDVLDDVLPWPGHWSQPAKSQPSLTGGRTSFT